MKIIELIKKQETQSKIALTDQEREVAIAFFKEREAEAVLLKTEEPITKDGKDRESNVHINRLRDDIPSPNADRNGFLSLAPNADGSFVRVPKTL